MVRVWAERRWSLLVTRLVAFPLALGACTNQPPPAQQTQSEALLLNHIQVLGSHNSYKQGIDSSLLELYARDRPEVARSLEYQHISLTEQLELGLRKLELDVFHDPEGGRYAEPAGLLRVAEAELPAGPVFDPVGVMRAPGFKVLHVQDLDFRSNCLTLGSCLEELRTWSEAHPRHLPIVVTFNAKDQVIDRPGFVEPLPFGRDAFDQLDQALLAIGRDRILTPDDVRGDQQSLEGAILEHGWPTLEECRGRFLFVLDEGGEKLETYVRDHPSLRGRVMFVNADEGRPEAAFRIVNDPVGDGGRIRRLVRVGYLVRTRADADTEEARSGDTGRREAAFASGAHFVSTDYYLPNPDFSSGYQVTLPGGGVARCNPLSAPSWCHLSD